MSNESTATVSQPLLAPPTADAGQVTADGESNYVIPVVNPKSPKPPHFYEPYDGPSKRPLISSRRIGTVTVTAIVSLMIVVQIFAPHRMPPMPESIKPYAAPLQRVYDQHAHLLPGGAKRWRDQLFQAPQESLDEDEIAVREPTAEHTMTIITLHDLGDAQDRFPLHHRMAGKYPGIKWVAPQAPNISVSVFEGASMSGWYDVRHIGQLHWDEDEEGMIESHRKIHEVIERERQVFEDDGKEPRIAIVGFSQGEIACYSEHHESR